MKNLYIKFLPVFCVFFITLSCKAQEYPLNTDFMTIPNHSYLKDFNNELDTYIGIYKGSFNNKGIDLYITKQYNKSITYSSKQFYRDVLLIKFIVKDSNGIVLQDTQNMVFQPNQITHTIYSLRTKPALNMVSLTYGGTNCGVGNGRIYLKKLNSTQLSWDYYPDDTIIDSNKCPSGTDINIYLPQTKDLLFTKQ